MKQPIKLEYEVHWTLNTEKMLKDPMGRGLRALGKQVPYRIYLEPSNELLSDRMFDIFNPFFIYETHHLSLDHGSYKLTVQDPSGWLSISLKNIKLNTVGISQAQFSLE